MLTSVLSDYVMLDKYGDVVSLFAMSDIHLGSRGTEIEILNRDLKKAKEANAKMFIIGDVFDAIVVKDMKRYDPDTVCDELQGSRDILGRGIDLAMDLLKPYADNIELIGYGNHEIAVERHHSFDLIRNLTERLNRERKSGKIFNGGVGGFYSLRLKRAGSISVFKIYWHHGAGGSAPVSRGTIDFNRMLAGVEGVDLIWIGHKHEKLITQQRRIMTNRVGELQEKNVNFLITPGYYNPFKIQSQEDIMKEGRVGNYAVDHNLQPKPIGGAMVNVSLMSNFPHSDIVRCEIVG